MWHVSISQQRRTGTRRNAERQLEQEAVRLLAGVGGAHEWWLWSHARIGHLRVPLTDTEAAQLPPWDGPINDAGDTGPRRPRTRRR